MLVFRCDACGATSEERDSDDDPIGEHSAFVEYDVEGDEVHRTELCAKCGEKLSELIDRLSEESEAVNTGRLPV